MDLVLAPEVRRGEHACCVFASDDDQARLVERFARDALGRGDRVFYLADVSDESDVVDLLDEAGLEGRARLDRGQLQIMHSSEMGLEGGFDSERQLSAWAGLVELARADGYSALAACAEMTWTRAWGLTADEVVGYEASAEPVFTSGELSALCQYDTRQFPTALVDGAVDVHPVSIALSEHRCSVDYGRMHLHAARPSPAIAIGGEIDLTGVPFLEHQLTERLADGDATADCSELRFVDIAACRLLRRACLGELGAGRLELENVPPALARVMNLCKWADGRG